LDRRAGRTVFGGASERHATGLAFHYQTGTGACPRSVEGPCIGAWLADRFYSHTGGATHCGPRCRSSRPPVPEDCPRRGVRAGVGVADVPDRAPEPQPDVPRVQPARWTRPREPGWRERCICAPNTRFQAIFRDVRGQPREPSRARWLGLNMLQRRRSRPAAAARRVAVTGRRPAIAEAVAQSGIRVKGLVGMRAAQRPDVRHLFYFSPSSPRATVITALDAGDRRANLKGVMQPPPDPRRAQAVKM